MSGGAKAPDISDIARRIRRMAILVRGEAHSLMRLRPAPAGVAAAQERAARPEPGWWVLAQGRPLDPEDFDDREAAREELLDAVRRAGVLVPENVWVWDETARAQLVLSTLPTRERADRVAVRLRSKGLRIVVRREMP